MDKSSSDPLDHLIESNRQARELKKLWDGMNQQERDRANKIFALFKVDFNKVLNKANGEWDNE